MSWCFVQAWLEGWGRGRQSGPERQAEYPSNPAQGVPSRLHDPCVWPAPQPPHAGSQITNREKLDQNNHHRSSSWISGIAFHEGESGHR